MRCSRHALAGRSLRTDAGHAGEICFLAGLGIARGLPISPGEGGRREVGVGFSV